MMIEADQAPQVQTASLAEWVARVERRETRIGIIGLGYVGLPLAMLFSAQRFRVTGFDTDKAKVAALGKGRSYMHRIEAEHIAAAKAAGFCATDDFAALSACDAVLICVPTPLDSDHQPDLSYVRQTLERIAPHTRPRQLLVLESTTWPGTTTELMVPILERLGPPGTRVLRGSGGEATDGTTEDMRRVADEEMDGLMVAFSPEREDPGNLITPRREIPKVIGGVDERAARAAEALYGTIFDRTVLVSSPEAAEMTKLLENIYRNVNIALVNEMKQLCMAMGIDIWEVIEAASTKPFGFQAFYPGPGIGGHCIPVDPFYLTWRAKQFGQTISLIERAGEINEAMPGFVLQTVERALERDGKTLAGAKILLLGMAYKRDVDDLRESPSLVIFEHLRAAGAEVAYNDPFFAEVGAGRHYSVKLKCTPLEKAGEFDCVLLLTDHSAYNIAALVEASSLFVDTRNATRGLCAANIVRC